MTKKGNDLKPQISEKTNLRQAVEWVAFGLKPLTPEYDKAFCNRKAFLIDSNTEESKKEKIISAQRQIFVALREGCLVCEGLQKLDVIWENDTPNMAHDFTIRNNYNWVRASEIPSDFWEFDQIFWDMNCLLYKTSEAENNTGRGWFAASEIEILTEHLFTTFPEPETEKKEEPAIKAKTENPSSPMWIDFSNHSGQLILNDIFTVAIPTSNSQNYQIIRYLIENPNRFVTVNELKANALGGKDLDKRLTDFAVQINMNKDLGKLFFDNGNDSIRLNNPVTAERMTEKNIRRVRIKPA